MNADENFENNLRKSAKSEDKYSWRFVPAENLIRQHSDVLVESKVRDALIRLNQEIKAQPDRADEVRYACEPIAVTGCHHDCR